MENVNCCCLKTRGGEPSHVLHNVCLWNKVHFEWYKNMSFNGEIRKRNWFSCNFLEKKIKPLLSLTLFFFFFFRKFHFFFGCEMLKHTISVNCECDRLLSFQFPVSFVFFRVVFTYLLEMLLLALDSWAEPLSRLSLLWCSLLKFLSVPLFFVLGFHLIGTWLCSVAFGFSAKI